MQQQLTGQICSLRICDRDGTSKAVNNLLQSMVQPAFSIQAAVTCCSVFSVSRRESESSSPDSYISIAGDHIQSSNEQQLHYPSYVHLDHGDATLVLPESVTQLEGIIHRYRRTAGSGYEEGLRQAFSDNSDTFSSFFYELGIPWILQRDTNTCMDPSECTEELTNGLIITLKINAQVLSLMQQQLCEQSRPYWEIKIGYFTQFAKAPIDKLLEIAVSLSKQIWSPLHIGTMLLAYEALRDGIAVIKEISSSEYNDLFHKVLANMKESFREVFDDIEKYIQSNMAEHEGGTIHPMTCFLICSIKNFHSHKNLVRCTLIPDDDTNSFGHLLYGVVSCWRSMLDQHSKIYEDRQQQCIFLLNNTRHFDREIKDLLGGLLSDGQITMHNEEHELLFKSWESYMRKACIPAKSFLKRNYWRGSRPSLVAFSAQFDETFGCQSTWGVPDVALRQKLKDFVEDCILPEYISSLKNIASAELFSCSCLQIDSAENIYTEESLKRTVQCLFEG